nr:M56 family metallopeptidase [Streptomonospora sp. PA3]
MARLCGLEGRVTLIGAAAPYALTYGFAAPRVLVSTGLLRLDDAELTAVLCHEREHVRNRDPLKTLLARALPAFLFFLPYLRHLRHRFTAARELAADRGAAAVCGTRPLAGALLKVSEGPRFAAGATVAAMGAGDLLDLRVAQLETDRPVSPPAAGRRTAVVSAAAAAGGVFLLGWAAWIVAAYPAPCALA